MYFDYVDQAQKFQMWDSYKKWFDMHVVDAQLSLNSGDVLEGNMSKQIWMYDDGEPDSERVSEDFGNLVDLEPSDEL